MMELTNLQAYGCLILRELRRHPGWVSRSALAQAVGVTSQYVQYVMRRFMASGIVARKMGPGGGYRLAYPMHRVTVLEVVRALPEKGRPSPVAVEELRGRVGVRINAVLARMKVDSL